MSQQDTIVLTDTSHSNGLRPDVVSARRLSLEYQTGDGPVHALANVDFGVRRGEFVSLIGPSGCGKTTLLRLIADLAQPTGGEIDVDGMTPSQARKAGLYGFVFQAPALYSWRTVLRNVMLPLEIKGGLESERRSSAERALGVVELGDFAGKFPWQLSGGMQQRVSIARALSFGPKLLLMDEPFGALDEITRDNLNLHLSQLWAANDLTVVFVTHSIPEAVFLSSRIVVMSPRPGQIVESIDSDLPRRRDLDLRETPEFHDLTARIRAALRRGRSYE